MALTPLFDIYGGGMPLRSVFGTSRSVSRWDGSRSQTGVARPRIDSTPCEAGPCIDGCSGLLSSKRISH